MVHHNESVLAGAFDQSTWSECDLFNSISIREAQHDDIDLPGNVCRRHKGFASPWLREL
jgi:hypothetical protein